LLPAFVHDALHGDASQLSIVIAAGGVGALSGSAIAASLGHFPRRGILLVGSATVFGALIVMLSIQRSVVPAAILAAITSAACWTYTGIHVSTYQGRTPDHLMGRVVGMAILCLTTLLPLGSLLLGSLGSLVGVNLSIGMGGGALVVTGIVTLA